jgi:hypothetical protein
MTRTHLQTLLTGLFAMGGALPAAGQDAYTGDAGTVEKRRLEKIYPPKPSYSPYAGRNFPSRPFFGDTHLHTSFSMDAGAAGARLTPRDALRFARARRSRRPVDSP